MFVLFFCLFVHLFSKTGFLHTALAVLELALDQAGVELTGQDRRRWNKEDRCLESSEK